MPREPPVTRAVLPSSEQKLETESLLELLEPGEVVHRDGLDARLDPLHETGKHLARPDLDEGLDALVDELLRRLRELHGPRQLVAEERAELLRVLDPCGESGHERHLGLLEVDRVHVRAQGVGGLRYMGAVERPRYG